MMTSDQELTIRQHSPMMSVRNAIVFLRSVSPSALLRIMSPSGSVVEGVVFGVVQRSSDLIDFGFLSMGNPVADIDRIRWVPMCFPPRGNYHEVFEISPDQRLFEFEKSDRELMDKSFHRAVENARSNKTNSTKPVSMFTQVDASRIIVEPSQSGDFTFLESEEYSFDQRITLRAPYKKLDPEGHEIDRFYYVHNDELNRSWTVNHMEKIQDMEIEDLASEVFSL